MLLALALGGCATASTDLAFDEAAAVVRESEFGAVQGNEAVLVVAVGPISMGGGYSFRAVDAEGADFAAAPVTLGFGAWGLGDKMKRPAGEPSSVWVVRDEINFLVKKVPAGRYAATQATWNTYNGYSSGSAWLCRKEGAPTFDLAPGSITVVSSRDAFPAGTVTRLSNSHTDADVLAQFERTRAGYPLLKGQPVLARPAWETSWSPKPEFMSDACNSVLDGSLTLMSLQSRSGDGAPDAAERAAIAAALENLKKRGEAAATAGSEK